MPYTVPEPYCWDKSFMTFYDQIDNEHKGLFQGLFDVGVYPGSVETLRKCNELMAAHFAYEQSMMLKASYPEYAHHKAAHDGFLTTLGKLECPVNASDVDYAKDWLVQHIKTVDFPYRGKL
ncbi:PREDICTED: myohemerythrin-1-like [Priapulus caudatus]|uniref:Myohemerythrin-1-like n=1 Tax=Priapulus caudatus TaxID=37621 RepID=A0ABM1DWL8_PRICU|nr:PREDICTED: myohemerythrin-1-like [Priapulus caudatus]